MKEIKFLVATLFVALLPIMFSSCGEKNTPDEITIVGKWEVTEAIRSYYFVNDQANVIESESYEVGQVWEFTKDSQLTVAGATYTYNLSNNVLATDYATNYYSGTVTGFDVPVHTADQLVLSVTYTEKDKVGERKVTNKLTFKRVVE